MGDHPLQLGVGLLVRSDRANGVEDGGVVPAAEVPADLLEGVSRVLACQEHADLAWKCDRAVALL